MTWGGWHTAKGSCPRPSLHHASYGPLPLPLTTDTNSSSENRKSLRTRSSNLTSSLCFPRTSATSSSFAFFFALPSPRSLSRSVASSVSPPFLMRSSRPCVTPNFCVGTFGSVTNFTSLGFHLASHSSNDGHFLRIRASSEASNVEPQVANFHGSPRPDAMSQSGISRTSSPLTVILHVSLRAPDESGRVGS